MRRPKNIFKKRKEKNKDQIKRITYLAIPGGAN
jgi:hypothetical protein